MNSQEILERARHHHSPEHWHIFTGKEHSANKNTLTSHDPIPPLLIITENSLVEYINSSIPIKTILFEETKDIRLRIVEKELQEDTWLFLVDIQLTNYDNQWLYWSIQPNFQEERDIIIQRFIEAYTIYKFLYSQSSKEKNKQ